MAEKIEIAKVQLGLDTSTFEQQFQNLISKFPNDIMKLFDALNKYSGTKNIGESLFREPIQKAIEQSKKDYQNFAEFVADINRQITDQSLKFTYNTKAGRATIGGTGYKSSDLATITKEVEKVITAQKTKTTPADKKSTSTNADALNKTLTQTVDNLNTTVQNLNSASSSLNTSATNIGNSASALGTANANLGNTSQSISGASATLNTAAQAVSNAANALSGAAQNTGNPSTNSSTGGGNGSSSSIGNSASTFKGSIVHLDEFSVQTVKSMDLAAKTSQKATASVINAQRILEKFAGKYGDLLRNVSLIFGDTGDLQKINATLRLSAKESANISLTPSDIQNVMANPKKLELKDALLQSGGVSSLHRVYTDETAQIEVYKKLLKEQYALERQIAEAHAKEDRFLENKLRYQLSYNRAQKDFLNQGRIAAGRDVLTNTYGDVKDTESIAYANKKYKDENERIIPIIKEREKNNALISEEENKIKELTSLLEKEMNLKTQISKLKPSSRKASDLNVDLQQTRQRIDELRVVSKSSSGTYGNRVNELVSRYRGSGSREEVNTYNELIRLEDERFETWKKYKTAKEKGNTQEASFYGQQIANLKKEYSELLDVAKATGTLNQEIEKQLNLHREYNKEQQRAITLRARDKKLQNEQTTNYSKATKSLQEYVELRREEGKLTNKAGNGDKGIYTAAYQNVQDKMSAITGTSGLGNLIDFSSGQMSLKSFNTTLGITREQYEKLRTVVAEANATIKDDTIKAKQESDLATLNKMITAYINLKKAQSTLQEYKARAYNDATVNQQQAVVDRLQAQYNALLKDNDALAKTSTYTNMVAEANAKMADNVTRSNQSNSKQLTLLERLKASFQRTAAVAFSFNIFNRLFMEMRQGLSNVIEKTKEFDKTMTEVQMVTNQTDTSVRKTLASYSELAKELGTTTDAVAKGNLEWLRQGKSAEDSAKLIRASTMMSTLGAMESSEATQKLTAILNSYKLEADDAITVVDKLVNADLIAATSTEELATAFQYSASFASAAGVSFDKMVGMLTTASETTRLSAETVGQAFKSMFSRLQNVKAGKSIDDEGEAINDSEKVLKRYNIALRDSATEFRNLEDVLDDVGRRWNEFDTVEQAQIATAIAGVHQRNTFIAVMQNYDKVLEYTNKTMEASGTSAQKYTHHMSSLEAKINELTVQWEQFIQGLNQSGTIKIGVSLLSGLLSVLDALTNKVPVLQGVLTTILSFKVANGVIKSVIPNVVNMGNSFSKLAKKIKAFKLGSLNKAFKQFDSILLSGNKTMSTYEKWQTALVISNKKLNQEQKISALTGMGFTEAQATQLVMNKNLAITIDEMVAKYGMNDAALIRSTLLTGNLTEAEKVQRLAQQMKMSAQLKGIPITEEQATADAELVVQNYAVGASGEVAAAGMSMLNLVLAGLMVVATGVIAVVTTLNQQAEQARDNAIETINAYNDTSSSIEDLVEKYKKLKKEYDSISETSLKNEKAEELLDLRDQIVETYGSEANGIDIVNGKLETTLATLKQISQQRASETWTDISDEVAAAFDYEKSIGFWNYGDTVTGKVHGAVTQIGDRGTATRYSDVIEDLWSEINRLGGEINPTNMALMFGSESYFQTVENMKQLLTTIDEKISSGEITKESQEIYQNFRDMLSQEIKAIENDTEYQQNKQILENAKDIAIDSLSKTFTEGDYAGQTVREVLDQYTEITSQMNALASSGEVDEKAYNDLKTIADNLLQTLSTATGLTSNERMAELVGRSITEAGQEFEKSQQKAQANILIDKAVKSSGLSEKIKGMFATDIKQTQDKEITDLLDGIRKSLKDKNGIDMSISEIVDSLELLGYTYQKTETITATDLIAGFPTDAKQITNAVGNIEKLNNAIKALSEGTTPDIEELFELKTASIDITNLTQGGLDNIAKIEAVRNDYVQSMLDTLDEQLAINNATMTKQKDITDEQRLEITNQNKLLELEKQIISNAVDGVKTTANEYITAIKSAGELIAEVAGYGDSTISEDILSSMVDQYSGMASIVEKYRLGMIDNDELLKAFKQFYNNDIDNFYDYQQKKYMKTDEYYSSWLNENSSFVEEFKNKYGIDLKNYTNYIDAKSAIENKYSKIRADAEKYQLAELFDEDNNLKPELRGAMSNAPSWYIEMLKEYQEYLKDYPKIIEEFTNKFDQGSSTVSVNLDEELNSRLDIITSRMKEAYSLIHELGQEGSQITLDTLDSMKSAYPAMIEYVDKYLRKEMTRQELIAKFKEMYEQDKQNYVSVSQEKLMYNEDFTKKVLEKNSKLVKDLWDKYKIDLKNFATIQQAKEELIKAFEDSRHSVDIAQLIDFDTGELTKEWYSYIQGMTEGMISDAGLGNVIALSQILKAAFSEATDTIGDTADTIEDLITGAVYSVEDALSDVSTVLSKQVEYYEDIANGIVAAAQLEIDALDKEIDLLDKKNEAQQRQIALQEKLEALNKAKTQRSVREYNAETGQFEWTTNKKDIKKAQEEYNQQLTDNQKQALEDEKEWYEKYGESFSSVSETIQNRRDIQQGLNWLAQYRGVDVSTLTSKDLLSLSKEEQSAFRSAYGRAVDVNLGFEEAQSQKELRKAQTNLVSGGYATNGKTGFAFNWEAITNALGSSITTLASTLDKYTEILKPTSFAETKPTANAVTNITNTGEVKNSYTFTGDMEFKFDKDVDADNFISKFVSKLQMQNGITTVK